MSEKMTLEQAIACCDVFLGAQGEPIYATNRAWRVIKAHLTTLPAEAPVAWLPTIPEAGEYTSAWGDEQSCRTDMHSGCKGDAIPVYRH
jgi:hypothetical protein